MFTGLNKFSMFQENYGKAEPSNVAKVKALYKELDLEVCH